MSIFDTVAHWWNSARDAVRPSPLNLHPAFNNGWWVDAERKPAHPGRVGGLIKPMAIVVHDTDMHPDDYNALIKSWTTQAALGDCAHFVIAEDGSTVQFVSITRNANHAGGPDGRHGWFVVEGKSVHPNSISVGIEMHYAGACRLVNAHWYFGEDEGQGWRPQGSPLESSRISIDPRNPQRGYHGPTTAQLDTLHKLVSELQAVIGTLPSGTKIVPHGVGVSWNGYKSPALVGHCSLDPGAKTDPGPVVMSLLQSGKL